MKKNKFIIGFVVSLFCILIGTLVSAAEIGYYLQGPANLGSYHQRAGAILPNEPAYLWWYGCSPTSAGMMMGYYDRNGYGGKNYDNLVAGGVAEVTNGPLSNAAIASAGHINAFYRNGYLGSGDDIPGLHPNFDSLADFMGTSQDSVGNSNGSTTFYYFTNGDKLTGQDAFNFGISDQDGMYGMWEYTQYAGYNMSTSNFFTQLTDNQNANGFSFADYMAAIDAGLVVMIQVEGHSMFGYGYDTNGSLVFLHDTWDTLQHTMTWGGYYSGMNMWGVTCFTPEGGTIPGLPEPGTIIMLICGLMGIVRFRRYMA